MATTKRSKLRVPSVEAEFASVDLGDVRRRRRLQTVAKALSAAPDRSFPEQMGSDAASEGFYRLVESDYVGAEAILDAYAEQTALRVQAAGVALDIQDTTELQFPGEVRREGLGWFGRKAQGFLFHPSFAVDAASLQPLGILDAQIWTRTGVRTSNGNRKRAGKDKESGRWWDAVVAAKERLRGRGQLVHVADREGDIYELFAEMVAASDRFVIRLTQDRRVQPEEEGLAPITISEALEGPKQIVDRSVSLSARKPDWRPSRSKSLPPRDARKARLAISAKCLEILRPKKLAASSGLPASIKVNVVHVQELSTPEGEEPVDWRLITTEPVATPEDCLKIVDWYRARWLIEELFKALKTGCAFEDRQLESLHTLQKALMIFLPVAVQMLLMRHLERMDPNSPATSALTSTQIRVLQAHPHAELGPNPTVREALRAIARLGGFLKTKHGKPGWLTLSRGMVKLGGLAFGWSLALSTAKGANDDLANP